MILALMLPYSLDVVSVGRGALGFGVIAGVFIGLGLSMPAVYAVYVIKKWSDSLHQAIIIELRDLKIRIKVDGRNDLIDVITEIEYLLRELGAPLLQSRDLWEIMAALGSLVATIAGVLSRLGS